MRAVAHFLPGRRPSGAVTR